MVDPGIIALLSRSSSAGIAFSIITFWFSKKSHLNVTVQTLLQGTKYHNNASAVGASDHARGAYSAPQDPLAGFGMGPRRGGEWKMRMKR